jgi:UDP-glucose 4-epimerase
MVIPRFVQQALNGEPLTVYGDGQQSRCFLHVHDAVEAILSLAGSAEAVGQVFNIGSTQEVTIAELAQQVLAVAGANGDDHRTDNSGSTDTSAGRLPDSGARIEYIPYDQAYAVGFEDMRKRVPDISKIDQVTGWSPQLSLERILDDVVRQFIIGASD